MYKPETILELKEPVAEDDPLAPYNRVRVVGPSPLNHAQSAGEWVGSQATGVIITPDPGFGPTLDEPVGKLNHLYKVVSEPAPLELPGQPVIRQAELGPSPEEVFAAEAEQPPKEKPVRRRPATTKSPEEQFRGEA